MIWPDGAATLLGGVLAFAFRALYYAVLGGPWRRAAGVQPSPATARAGRLFLILVLTILIAGGVGWLLATVGITNSVPSAVAVSAIAWLTLLFAPMVVNHRAAERPFALTAIDGVHWLVVMEIAALTHVTMAGAPKFG